jgi:hypothetical protein
VLDETSQGGILLESTLADDFSLLCPLQMDFEQVLHRPVEITAFIGPLVRLRFSHILALVEPPSCGGTGPQTNEHQNSDGNLCRFNFCNMLLPLPH